MENKVIGYIYKITNKINKKVYIGLTTKTIEERWKQHIITANGGGKDSNSIFKRAIRKYGKDNFIVEEIDREYESIDNLKQKEIYWIGYYHSYVGEENSLGYNSTRGGDLGTELQKIPIVQFDICSGKKIKEYSSIAEAQQEIKCRIEHIGEVNYSGGGFCFLKKENIQNLSDKEIKEKVHSLYPTLLYQLDKKTGKVLNIYRTAEEACEKLNYKSTGNIISCCLGNRIEADGYQWCYQRDKEKRINKPARDINTYKRPVIQYGMNGKPIQEWASITEAAINLKLQDSHISSCCNKKRQSCGQFQWRYKDDNISELKPLLQKRKVQCIETQEIFPTMNHAAKHFNYAPQTVKKSCMGEKINKEYHFQFYDGE